MKTVKAKSHGNTPPASPTPPLPLQVAYDAAALAYTRSVRTSSPGECWDHLILTATNEKQAAGYRAELSLRHESVGTQGAFFPAVQKSIVLSDPPGPRIGSGGATLNVIRALMLDHGLTPDKLASSRLLLMHSGGMSQRLPAYSPLGKIFAPLPMLRPDGQIATLFDQLYLQLAGLPERLGPGMLILAGDVCLLFDHRLVAPPGKGVTAITMRVDAEMGTAHGVFLVSAKGCVTRTLQKADIPTLKAAGAVDASGKVLIDTGLLFFDADTLLKLARLAGVSSARSGSLRITRPIHDQFDHSLDLYEDVAGVLAGQELNKSMPKPMRQQLHKTLDGSPFGAMEVQGEFLHLGTTRQFRDAMIGRSASPAAKFFQHNVLAHTTWPIPDDSRVYHSVLLGGGASGQAGGTIGRGAVLEHSILRAPSKVGDGSVVSQVEATDTPIDLPAETLFFQVPVRLTDHNGLAGEGFVQVICGVNDDFKGKWADGKCLLHGQDIRLFLKRIGLDAQRVWPDVPLAQRTLWNAKLFPLTVHRSDTQLALSILCSPYGQAAKATDVLAFRRCRRMSMADALATSDPERLIEHRQVIAAVLQSHEMLDHIAASKDVPVDGVVRAFSSAAALYAACDVLEAFARVPVVHDPKVLKGKAGAEAVGVVCLQQARAAWSSSQIMLRPGHPDADARYIAPEVMNLSFAKVAEATEAAYEFGGDSAATALSVKFRPGMVVEASSPVRLDLAGGWSDTPPYCFDRGGHVINLAIDLDGRAPVRAVVQTTRQPHIVLESLDLGKTKTFIAKELASEMDIDVHDPFVLHKVALRLVGLIPAGTGRKLPTGLHISTECRVPKGSGLGTSSILAATLLGALRKLLGQSTAASELIPQTLLLEQRLSTGGGWQDQVGGIVGGVKSTITQPGVAQRPVVEKLAMSQKLLEQLQDRIVVYYSGQQRLARNILRRVMGRYLGRDPSMILLMEGLKTGAAALRKDLIAGRWASAAHHINDYWRIKREVYPGATTPAIDILLLEHRHDYLAASLAGAGGGGFGYFLCKDAASAKRLRLNLQHACSMPGNLGAVYETRINTHGLKVTSRRTSDS